MSAISRRRPGVSSHVILQSLRSSRFFPGEESADPWAQCEPALESCLGFVFLLQSEQERGRGRFGKPAFCAGFPATCGRVLCVHRRGTVHAHYFLGSKKKTKDTDVTRVRLTLHPGISNFLTGRIREDPSEELWNYVSTNSSPRRIPILLEPFDCMFAQRLGGPNRNCP